MFRVRLDYILLCQFAAALHSTPNENNVDNLNIPISRYVIGEQPHRLANLLTTWIHGHSDRLALTATSTFRGTIVCQYRQISSS